MLFYSCSKTKDIFQYELIPVKIEDKWGYIDSEGKIIINPQFDEAFLFSEGLALVKTNNKYGYISDDGKYVINPMYMSATYFFDGLALVVTENGYPTFINKKGEIKFTVNEADECRLFYEGLAAFKSNQKWGFIDNSGKISINAQFDRVGNFEEDMAFFANDVEQKLKYGYINKKGEIIINPQFDEAYNFVDGLALVKLNDKYGFIDKTGKFIINAQFDVAASFSDGLSLVKSGDKFGFIDESGKIVINPQFDKVGSFNDGLALAINNDNKFGFINKKGVFEINPQFEEAREFKNNLAPFKSQVNKYGFINTEGKIIINPQFTDVYDIRFYKNYIYSDYLNITTLTTYLLDKTDEKNFRGVNKNTDFGTISNDIHKNDQLLESTNYSVTVKVDKEIDNYAKIENFKYTFTDKIYNIKPTYQYLHHWGNYQTGTKKEMNFGAKVSSLEIEMYLFGKANGKNDKVVSVISNSIAELFKTKPSEITDGMHIESSDLKIDVTAERKLLTGKIYVNVKF